MHNRLWKSGTDRSFELKESEVKSQETVEEGHSRQLPAFIRPESRYLLCPLPSAFEESYRHARCATLEGGWGFSSDS